MSAEKNIGLMLTKINAIGLKRKMLAVFVEAQADTRGR